LKIPLPKSTAVVNCNNSIGKAKYEPDNGGVLWRIKKFNGDFESILRCEIEYVSQPDKPWVKPPI
jgi:AP-2 complex subunit mu-1